MPSLPWLVGYRYVVTVGLADCVWGVVICLYSLLHSVCVSLFSLLTAFCLVCVVFTIAAYLLFFAIWVCVGLLVSFGVGFGVISCAFSVCGI